MSLETWKKQFYNIEAKKVCKKDAIQHSLTKWIGLLPSNLKRHKLIVKVGIISDNELNNFSIDNSSCALCKYYYDSSFECGVCPLYKIRNNIPCDEIMVGEDESPYFEFIDNDNPKPMIEWLRKCLKKK